MVVDILDGGVETLASSAAPLASAEIQKSKLEIQMALRILNTVAPISHANKEGIRIGLQLHPIWGQTVHTEKS